MMKRRTKFAAAVVVTAAGASGCFMTSKNPPEPDTRPFPDTSNPPPPIAVASYDVIVTSETVRIEPSYSPNDASCRPRGVEEFPAIGECTEQTDAVSFPCGEPTASVTSASVDGVAAIGDPVAKRFSVTVNSSADSVLVLDGIFGPINVALNATGLPTPTVTATELATGYDIAWTTDVPAASAVVDVTAGLIVKHCHVTMQSYGYAGDPSAVIGVRVQPFLSRETHSTPYGDIRVWRGNGRYQSL
jgi:hypothetical protein